MIKPNGILTLSTNGVSHLEIERRYAAALESAYRRGVKDGAKSPEDRAKQPGSVLKKPHAL